MLVLSKVYYASCEQRLQTVNYDACDSNLGDSKFSPAIFEELKKVSKP
jgi:hypothetical protein